MTSKPEAPSLRDWLVGQFARTSGWIAGGLVIAAGTASLVTAWQLQSDALERDTEAARILIEARSLRWQQKWTQTLDELDLSACQDEACIRDRLSAWPRARSDAEGWAAFDGSGHALWSAGSVPSSVVEEPDWSAALSRLAPGPALLLDEADAVDPAQPSPASVWLRRQQSTRSSAIGDVLLVARYPACRLIEDIERGVLARGMGAGLAMRDTSGVLLCMRGHPAAPGAGFWQSSRSLDLGVRIALDGDASGILAPALWVLMPGLALWAALVAWGRRLARARIERAWRPFTELGHQLRLHAEGVDDSTWQRTPPDAWKEVQELSELNAKLLRRLDQSRDEARQADAQLLEANAQLAAEVEQRDSYIDKQMRRLQDALNAARQASEAKSRLMTNTSHEIRTPLNGIIGTAEMLLRSKPLSASQASLLRVQLTAAKGLLALVNDILDLSRSAAQLEPGREPFDVIAESATICEALRADANKRGLKLELVVPPEFHGYRWGDRARFRQLLTNLVGNALKFTSEGSVRVELGESETSELVVRVHDTGIGIAEKDFERIFEPFVQVDSSSTRKYGGTGLGLSIARELTQAMSGDLSLHSQVGQGSCFTLQLPLDLAQAADLISEPRIDAEAVPAELPQGALRVLVVDDIDMNRDLLEMQVQALGGETAKVDGGAAAIAHVQTQPVDLVLLDCQMPQMDGYEAASRMRALEAGKRLRIVAVTAHAQPGERERCIAAGMDDYLSKPVTMDALRRVLAEAQRLARSAS